MCHAVSLPRSATSTLPCVLSLGSEGIARGMRTSLALALLGAAAAMAPTKIRRATPKFAPMPDALTSTVPGTWAHDTMSRRVVEDILDKVVYGDNEAEPWFASAKPSLDALRKEILADAPLRPIEGDGDDVAAWNALLEEHPNKTWLSAPWLVAEFYLYRRVAEATRWFRDGNLRGEVKNEDVFAKSKLAGLASATKTLEALAARTAELVSDPEASAFFLSLALWGNRMDLSLWPADAGVASSSEAFDLVLASSAEQLLADDTLQVTALLQTLRAKGGGTIDLVVDNAGFELCTDLLLADHLVASGAAKRIRFRVKHHPTFVSDALERDVDAHIAELTNGATEAVAARWKERRERNEFVCVADSYWAMPYALWEVPRSLYDELRTTSDLIVVKGDANYRRALGDRPWPWDAPFADVCSYAPAPLLCLRTLKAELGCGMAKAGTDRAASSDPTWLTDGRWGVAHFAPAAEA